MCRKGLTHSGRGRPALTSIPHPSELRNPWRYKSCPRTRAQENVASSICDPVGHSCLVPLAETSTPQFPHEKRRRLFSLVTQKCPGPMACRHVALLQAVRWGPGGLQDSRLLQLGGSCFFRGRVSLPIMGQPLLEMKKEKGENRKPLFGGPATKKTHGVASLVSGGDAPLWKPNKVGQVPLGSGPKQGCEATHLPYLFLRFPFL